MAPSTRRVRRSWPQRLLLSANVVLIVACVATALGLTVVRTKLSEVDTLELGVSLAPRIADDAPRNILIIGTDNADRLDPNDPVRTERPRGERLADVIMIVRLEPKEGRASLLSIPRDTWVPIAPFGTEGKINSAIAGSRGPENLIDTIKQNFAISIDNYVEVDFQGFRDLVAALGGIPVYLTVPIRDTEHTGLNLTKTGCITLDPTTALAYARSRHLQYKNPKTGKWVTDPSGDLGRISRQQDFIERTAQRAIDRGARNPATAFSLIDAATKAIVIDSTMSVGQLRNLAEQFSNFNVQNLQKYQLPTRSAGNSRISYQVVLWDQAQPILDVFRGLVYGRAVTPREVQVEMDPTTGSPTSAELAGALESHGFDVDVAADAGSSKRPAATTIRYGARGREAAAVLARWLDGDARFSYDPDLPGARLRLAAGANLTGVRTEPLPDSAVEAPSLAEATTTTLPSRRGGSTTTVASGPADGVPTTSPAAPPTTVIGVVPVDPAAAADCR